LRQRKLVYVVTKRSYRTSARDLQSYLIMPRDAPLSASPLPSVVALTPGPLGPRFRVRGLRGNDALASWLESRVAAPAGARCVASAGSGIVRADARRAAVGFDWRAEIARCVEAFGLAERSRRTLQPALKKSVRGGRTNPPVMATPRRYGDRSVRPDGHDEHAVPLNDLLQRLGATARGLSTAEARQRLQRDGPNELPDIAARSDLDILLSQFTSVPVALLGGSGALAIATRAWGDAAAIAAVLAANGGIGYVTERRAEQTVSSLRKLAPRTAAVLRNGKEMQIAAREVVVGDVLVLRPGEPVAADSRVIESHRLSANEAPLTGESLPVRKEPVDQLPATATIGDRRNLVHMGTVISGGTGSAVVVATGERTALGTIRALAQDAEAPRTRLQLELDGLGKRLAIGASGLCLAVFVLGVLRGRAAAPMLRTAVSLGVAAIPEGLPTVATSLLAAGIRTLQKRNVYARRLDAIENLGAVDVVGFDKTGTLTENRMQVAAVSIGTRRTLVGREEGRLRLPPDLALVGALCNEVEDGNGRGWQGSSTELAVVDFVAACGADVRILRQQHPRLLIKQRSEHHPYMVTLHGVRGGAALVCVKGRPHEVLERCTHWLDGARVKRLTAARRRSLLAENELLAGLGQRVLAFAIKRQRARQLGRTGGLTWLGLIGLADPVRAGIGESIARFRAAGIRPVMLTGDQHATAQAVADAIGLDGGRVIVDGAALPENAARLAELVDNASGFARSSPAMKLQVIKALQARGHVVAMTGDGINDGPALKTADVGVAMGASGSDFAHAMSGLVLKDDHPDGLLAAIAEGRTSYLNVKKAVRYLVATNVSELALMTFAVAAGLPDPLDPIALLWTNLITDVSPAIALGLEPPEPDILQRPPFPRSEAFLGPRDWRTVALDGAVITAASAAAFLYGLSRYGASPRARTIAFATMTSSQLLYALSARSETPLTLLGRGRLRANPWLSRTVALSLSAQAATVLFAPLRRLLGTTPIGLLDAAVIAGCAAMPLLTREAAKRLRERRAARG
jgi:Ca2+-transporting ATPase